jgi:hypothetical protein
MILATVDAGDLVEVVWTASIAGIGVTVSYGLALLGWDRAIEYGRAGRGLEAVAYGALALVSAAIVLGALVFGIIVMVNK